MVVVALGDDACIKPIMAKVAIKHLEDIQSKLRLKMLKGSQMLGINAPFHIKNKGYPDADASSITPRIKRTILAYLYSHVKLAFPVCLN